jgi:hypothetical protein
MSEHDKCPHCDAEIYINDGDYIEWECGADKCHDGAGEWFHSRSSNCYEREIEQLRTERAAREKAEAEGDAARKDLAIAIEQGKAYRKLWEKSMATNSSRPRYECRVCGMVEYCDQHRRAEFPPKAAKRAITKRHNLTACIGIPTYNAGLSAAGSMVGQVVSAPTPEASHD